MRELRPIKVAIVEDDAELRADFGALVCRSPGMLLVHVSESAEEAEIAFASHPPHVALVDIKLPRKNGVECIRGLKRKHPGTEFVVLTVFEDDRVLFEALKAGATGYMLKTASPESVLAAIEDAHQGGSPMSAQIARRVVEHFRKLPAATPSGPSVSEWKLTPREVQVLELLARGLLYKEIASKLVLSVETVRKHLHNIYAKLEVTSRTEAVLKYLSR